MREKRSHVHVVFKLCRNHSRLKGRVLALKKKKYKKERERKHFHLKFNSISPQLHLLKFGPIMEHRDRENLHKERGNNFMNFEKTLFLLGS